ncbi:MAG: hypothetical protein BJ554DRAFT_5589 [Olpidium bornovanus]|uniref:Eukaryotic translation initiation factor 3 subunit C N-terminal domain-containing protein n=1 Tax=Olpidium bornovanus TaxID=278681 RepID=A0A8H7ZZC0_9FUNG|nr:MAG: hypothetical protein BJ554DRAFT_5589 [Olpidium bornovanus]
MSSRFFRGLSDSESESESDESVLSDEEEELSQDEAAQKQQPQHAFARGRRAISDSDESDEEEVRVVRSAKDKRFEELRAAVKVIENAKKINDWVAIQNGERQRGKTNGLRGRSDGKGNHAEDSPGRSRRPLRWARRRNPEGAACWSCVGRAPLPDGLGRRAGLFMSPRARPRPYRPDLGAPSPPCFTRAAGA